MADAGGHLERCIVGGVSPRPRVDPVSDAGLVCVNPSAESSCLVDTAKRRRNGSVEGEDSTSHDVPCVLAMDYTRLPKCGPAVAESEGF